MAMSDHEPSNAVLATMIEALEERMKQIEDESVRWHSRMEGQMDAFSKIVVNLQTSAAVLEAKAMARADANATAIRSVRDDLADEVKTHHASHTEAEKASRWRTGALIAALTAIGTIAAAAVAFAVAVH